MRGSKSLEKEKEKDIVVWEVGGRGVSEKERERRRMS